MGFALYRRAALTAVVVMALALPLVLIPIAGYVLALCLGPYLGGRIGARKLPPDWHDFFKLTVGGGWALLLPGGLLVILGVLAQGSMAVGFAGGALLLGLAAVIWLFFAFGVNAAASLGGLPAPETPPEPEPTPEKESARDGSDTEGDEPEVDTASAEPSPDGTAPGDEAPMPPAEPRASDTAAATKPPTALDSAPPPAPPPPTLPPRGARSSATDGDTTSKPRGAVVRSRTGLRSRGAKVTADEVEDELSGIEKRMAERAASEQSRASSRMGAMARRRRQS